MNKKDKDTAGTLIYKLNKERKGHHMGDCAGEACPDWLTRQVEIIGKALSVVRQEARAAAFKEAIKVARQSAKSSQASSLDIAAAEILIRRLEAAAGSAPKDENDETNKS